LIISLFHFLANWSTKKGVKCDTVTDMEHRKLEEKEKSSLSQKLEPSFYTFNFYVRGKKLGGVRNKRICG